MITPAIGCTTLVVQGYFTQSGDCNVNENLVQINYSGFDSLHVYVGPDSLMDSACVVVTNACIDPNTIIFRITIHPVIIILLIQIPIFMWKDYFM